MQYTPNYNLITVEGTDIVNPLVQMNPNFTDIDAAMFANKQAVIGTASEIVTGTVHAITRSNPDSNYFRFTATGNWTSGDSMSVDGVSVSVYLSDGSTPATGAYIINSEVFALLSGTRLTLITSSGSATANTVSYDNSSSGLAATNVQNAIDEIAKTGVVKLWSNADPSTPFLTTDIDILTSRIFDTFIIEFSGGTVTFVEAGASANNRLTMVDSSGIVVMASRVVTTAAITGGYRINIATANYSAINTYGSAPASSPTGSMIIPLKIYGIERQ